MKQTKKTAKILGYLAGALFGISSLGNAQESFEGHIYRRLPVYSRAGALGREVMAMDADNNFREEQTREQAIKAAYHERNVRLGRDDSNVKIFIEHGKIKEFVKTGDNSYQPLPADYWETHRLEGFQNPEEKHRDSKPQRRIVNLDEELASEYTERFFTCAEINDKGNDRRLSYPEEFNEIGKTAIKVGEKLKLVAIVTNRKNSLFNYSLSMNEKVIVEGSPRRITESYICDVKTLAPKTAGIYEFCWYFDGQTKPTGRVKILVLPKKEGGFYKAGLTEEY
jgi:hypothetical protein